MNKTELLNQIKNEQTEWSYMIVLTRVIEDLVKKNSPVSQFDLWHALQLSGHDARILHVRDAILRLANRGIVEYDRDLYVYYNK